MVLMVVIMTNNGNMINNNGKENLKSKHTEIAHVLQSQHQSKQQFLSLIEN